MHSRNICRCICMCVCVHLQIYKCTGYCLYLCLMYFRVCIVYKPSSLNLLHVYVNLINLNRGQGGVVPDPLHPTPPFICPMHALRTNVIWRMRICWIEYQCLALETFEISFKKLQNWHLILLMHDKCCIFSPLMFSRTYISQYLWIYCMYMHKYTL